MAEATRYGNVVIATTDGDTVLGPLKIQAIKFVNGANATTATLKDSGTNVIWSSGVVGANANSNMDCFSDEWQARSQTYTVGLSAAGGKLYIYIG